MQEDLAAPEARRLSELRNFKILDTPAEQAYEDVVLLASHICGVPIALISLVDEDRQWFKAKVGIDAMQTPRGQAFCAHAILQPEEILEVQDATQDARFVNNPLVTGDPNIRFYAGAPLVTASGAALGTLCVIDSVPRALTTAQAGALKALSRQVMELLSLRHELAAEKLQNKALTLRLQALEKNGR